MHAANSTLISNNHLLLKLIVTICSKRKLDLYVRICASVWCTTTLMAYKCVIMIVHTSPTTQERLLQNAPRSKSSHVKQELQDNGSGPLVSTTHHREAGGTLKSLCTATTPPPIHTVIFCQMTHSTHCSDFIRIDPSPYNVTLGI